MATSYPGSLDNFTNPADGDQQDSVTVPHWQQHANINDAVEAIEAELGINPSGANSTVRERMQAIEDAITALGDTVFGALPNGSVTAVKIATDAITEIHLSSNIVGAEHLKSNAVTTDKVDNLAITGPKIGPLAIDYTKIAVHDKLRVSRVANQVLAGVSAAYITFDTETSDIGGFTTAIPTTQAIVPAGRGGLYIIYAEIAGFSNHANDFVRIRTSTADLITNTDFHGAVTGTYGSVTAIVDLPAGHVIRLIAVNGGAGSVNLTAKMYVLKLANA